MTNFFKARWNKDNFWNLMFAFTLATPVIIIKYCFDLINFTFALPSAIILLGLTMHFALKLNPVELENNIFKTKENEYAIKSAISKVSPFLFVNFLSSMIYLISIRLNISINFLIFLLCISTAYAIICNIPINLCLSKKLWRTILQNNKQSWAGYDHYSHNSPVPKSTKLTQYESLSSPRNLLSNPINKWHSGNIHNSNSIVTSHSNKWHSSNIYHRR